MINESKYSAEGHKCNESSIQSTTHELENDTLVRKSQRTPKKKTIKSYGFTTNKGKKRKKKPEKKKQLDKKKQPEKRTQSVKVQQAENKKQSPEKKKIPSQGQQKEKLTPSLVPNGTSFILHKIKEEPQESQHSEISSNNSVESTKDDSSARSNGHRGYERRPAHNIRYDKTGHWPEVDRTRSRATRCKMEECTRKTAILCTKCQVHLCVRAHVNCFKNFHVLTVDHSN